MPVLTFAEPPSQRSALGRQQSRTTSPSIDDDDDGILDCLVNDGNRNKISSQVPPLDHHRDLPQQQPQQQHTPLRFEKRVVSGRQTLQDVAVSPSQSAFSSVLDPSHIQTDILQPKSLLTSYLAGNPSPCCRTTLTTQTANSAATSILKNKNEADLPKTSIAALLQHADRRTQVVSDSTPSSVTRHAKLETTDCRAEPTTTGVTSSRYPPLGRSHAPNLDQPSPPDSSKVNTDPHLVSTRKRCLVFQERAEVVERAAERAARHSATDPAHRRDSFCEKTKPCNRQYSASSAGDESCSTRSNCLIRENSRTSSLATSPGTCFTTSAKASDLDLSTDEKPLPCVGPISTDESGWSSHGPNPANVTPATNRKLKFAQSPHKLARDAVSKLVLGKPHPASSTLLTSRFARTAISSEDEAIHPRLDPAKRSLSFSICPKPARDATPTAAATPSSGPAKSRSRLSASPAPHLLSYEQRISGVRGGGPVRSPAPTNIARPKHRPSPAVRSDSSGYSEDQEESSSDSDSDYHHSSCVSLSASEGDASRDSQEDEDDEDDKAEEDDDDDKVNNTGDREEQDETDSDQHHATSFVGSYTSENVKNNDPITKLNPILPSSSDQPLAKPQSMQNQANHSFALHRNSIQSGNVLNPADKKPNRSFLRQDLQNSSHPFCFLPDTFEEGSISPSPTLSNDESASVSGWALEVEEEEEEEEKEGGSRPISPRAHWQHISAATSSSGTCTPLSLPFRRGGDRTPVSVATKPRDPTRSALSQRSLSSSHAPCTDKLGPLHVDPLHTLAGSSYNMRSDKASRLMIKSFSSHARPSELAKSWTGLRRELGPGTAAEAGSAMSAWGLARPTTTGPSAFSSAKHPRCLPSVATCSTDTVVGATSPPGDNASVHLKNYLDYPPTSGSTTPGSGSHLEPSVSAASRYWSETLASFANSLADPKTQDVFVDSKHLPANMDPHKHERTHSVPALHGLGPIRQTSHAGSEPDFELEATAALSSSFPIKSTDFASAGFPLTKSHTTTTHLLSTPPRKPLPIKIVNPVSIWNSDRDGEAPVRGDKKRTTHKPKKHTCSTKSQASSPSAPRYLRIERQQEGPGGPTRLIAIEDEESISRRRKKKARSMEFEWGKCKLTE